MSMHPEWKLVHAPAAGDALAVIQTAVNSIERPRGLTDKQPSPSIAELLRMGPNKTLPLPSFEATKAFLREYYLHSRFEGRDGPAWGRDYSGVVTRSRLEDLSMYAITCVSMYDCNRGRAVWFDRSLTVLNPDESPAQVQRKPGNLTHIYGQSL